VSSGSGGNSFCVSGEDHLEHFSELGEKHVSLELRQEDEVLIEVLKSSRVMGGFVTGISHLQVSAQRSETVIEPDKAIRQYLALRKGFEKMDRRRTIRGAESPPHVPPSHIRGPGSTSLFLESRASWTLQVAF
jgi:hypothetical protein